MTQSFDEKASKRDEVIHRVSLTAKEWNDESERVATHARFLKSPETENQNAYVLQQKLVNKMKASSKIAEENL